MMKMKFIFNETKALEALAYIARECPGLTPLFVSKILFYADKWHMNRYARPIVADTYIAMPLGPVPSIIKNFIDENWNWVDKPEQFDKAIKIKRTGSIPRLMAGKRPPNLAVLSESDIECLNEALAFCKGKGAYELSNLTHYEKAWINAEQNKPMDYMDFIDDDNPNKDGIIEAALENSIHGVL